MEYKRIRIQFLFFFAALLITVGCESTLDFQFDAPPKLTIVSHLTPGSWEGQRVHVYASQSPLDSSNFYIPDNLVVDVSESQSGQTVRLDTTFSDGKIFFEFPSGFLKAGNNYTITAFAPGFDPVQATTSIPRPSQITDLIIKDIRIEQSQAHQFKRNIHYKLEFNIDHFESNRYYHLVFYNEYEGSEGVLVLIDPELSDDQNLLPHYDYGVLIDRLDLEEGKPLQFEFRDWAVDDQDLIRVYVELRSITADYYKYHSTLARQLIVRQDPFAEPVTIFNNIEGGYGNFSGFTQIITSSDLPH